MAANRQAYAGIGRVEVDRDLFEMHRRFSQNVPAHTTYTATKDDAQVRLWTTADMTGRWFIQLGLLEGDFVDVVAGIDGGALTVFVHAKED